MSAHALAASAYKPAAMALLHIVPADSSSGNPAAASSGSFAGAAGSSSGKQHKECSPDRLGVLRIEVFVFKHPGANHRLIAEDYQDWSLEKVTGRR